MMLQLKDAESEIERLKDQNSLLEEQLETPAEPEHSVSTGYDISGSLNIKEQEIIKLQTELESSQDSVKSMVNLFDVNYLFFVNIKWWCRMFLVTSLFNIWQQQVKYLELFLETKVQAEVADDES